MEQDYLYIGLGIVGFLLIFLIIILIKQSKTNTTEPRIHRTHSKKKGLASGVAAGLGIGVAIGIAMDNIGVGIAIGVAIGSSMGISFESASKKKHVQNELNTSGTFVQSQNSRTVYLIGLMAVLLGVLALGIVLFIKTK